MSTTPLQPATAHDGAWTVLPGQTPQGGHVLSVLLKRSYRILANQVCTRAEEDSPLNPGEVFWDTPMNSSVRYESDFVPFKLQTDVVVIGRAHAPLGVPIRQCQVRVRVGACDKQIVVTGDRQARFTATDRAPVFTDPAPFTEMGLRYERAYGGIDVFSDDTCPYPYPRNPLGSGFAVRNQPESVDRLVLPNLEDPGDPLTPERLCIGEFGRWTEQPQPVGLGWFPKIWQPRCQWAGVLPADRATEQEMRAAYAALVPPDQRQAYVEHGLPDMDFRFFNGASANMSLPYLTGGEAVATENLTPEGQFDFRLPQERPCIGLDIGSGIELPDAVLHTVQIRLEARELDLVWRAAVPYPGRDWLPQMRKMQVCVNRP